jgi:hypothetical protein
MDIPLYKSYVDFTIQKNRRDFLSTKRFAAICLSFYDHEKNNPLFEYFADHFLGEEAD